MRQFSGIVAITAIAISMSGCGTAHYFMPPQPLEKKEWQISVVWHFDAARLYTPRSLVFPDLNYWVGVGKETNLGFGSNFIWPSHLSFARYYRHASSDCWIAYGNLQPLSLNINPLLEIGGAYSFGNSHTRQTVAGGIAFGTGQAWRLLPDDKDPRWPIIAIRYTVAGADAGVSWAHYHGLTKRLVRNSFSGIDERPDTLLAATDIDSLTLRANRENRPREFELTVWTKTHGELMFHSAKIPPDFFYHPHMEFEHWSNGDYYMFYLSSYKKPEGIPFVDWSALPFARFIGDIRQLMTAQREKTEIAILRYPESFKNKVNSVNWLTADHAIGIAVFGNPE